MRYSNPIVKVVRNGIVLVEVVVVIIVENIVVALTSVCLHH